MSKLKLSKSSMQQQREQLKLFKKLLPSLDLKRRQLTLEAQKAREELEQSRQAADELEAAIGREIPMLAAFETDFHGLVKLTDYSVTTQNVVGVKLPALEKIECIVRDYSRLVQPHIKESRSRFLAVEPRSGDRPHQLVRVGTGAAY